MRSSTVLGAFPENSSESWLVNVFHCGWNACLERILTGDARGIPCLYHRARDQNLPLTQLRLVSTGIHPPNFRDTRYPVLIYDEKVVTVHPLE
jgi:hypothetical protein